jgi:ABC-type polysaccharide/polyol phosphate export permease
MERCETSEDNTDLEGENWSGESPGFEVSFGRNTISLRDHHSGSRMIQHLTAMWKFRHFLLSLVKLDLRLRYRRSVLGIGWSLLNPIAMTFVFTLVFSNLLGNGDPIAYAAYVLTGVAVWSFVRDSALNGCRCFLINESYIRQSPIPYTIYTLRTVLGQAIHSLIAIGVVVAMLAIFSPDAGMVMRILSVVPGLLLALLAAWATATIAAFVNVYFHDTQHLLEVGAQILFFLTPIMYNRKLLDDKGLGWVVDANPVSWLLELTRTPLLTGWTPTVQMYAAGAGFTLILAALAVGTTAWLQKRVIFHL